MANLLQFSGDPYNGHGEMLVMLQAFGKPRGLDGAWLKAAICARAARRQRADVRAAQPAADQPAPRRDPQRGALRLRRPRRDGQPTGRGQRIDDRRRRSPQRHPHARARRPVPAAARGPHRHGQRRARADREPAHGAEQRLQGVQFEAGSRGRGLPRAQPQRARCLPRSRRASRATSAVRTTRTPSSGTPPSRSSATPRCAAPPHRRGLRRRPTAIRSARRSWPRSRIGASSRTTSARTGLQGPFATYNAATTVGLVDVPKISAEIRSGLPSLPPSNAANHAFTMLGYAAKLAGMSGNVCEPCAAVAGGLGGAFALGAYPDQGRRHAGPDRPEGHRRGDEARGRSVRPLSASVELPRHRGRDRHERRHQDGRGGGNVRRSSMWNIKPQRCDDGPSRPGPGRRSTRRWSPSRTRCSTTSGRGPGRRRRGR